MIVGLGSVLLLRSPRARLASTIFAAGVGLGTGYTECTYGKDTSHVSFTVRALADPALHLHASPPLLLSSPTPQAGSSSSTRTTRRRLACSPRPSACRRRSPSTTRSKSPRRRRRMPVRTRPRSKEALRRAPTHSSVQLLFCSFCLCMGCARVYLRVLHFLFDLARLMAPSRVYSTGASSSLLSTS